MAQSRVGTLLLEADRRIAGSVDTEQGAITHAPEAQNPAHDSNPATAGVLDDLAEAALRTGAEVIVL